MFVQVGEVVEYETVEDREEYGEAQEGVRVEAGAVVGGLAELGA